MQTTSDLLLEMSEQNLKMIWGEKYDLSVTLTDNGYIFTVEKPKEEQKEQDND